MLTLRFLSELAMLGILAWWGVETGGSVVADVALAVAAPLAAAAVWGRWVAPKSGTRLDDPARLILEFILFGLTGTALWDLEGPAAGLAFLGAAGGLSLATRRVGEPTR